MSESAVSQAGSAAGTRYHSLDALRAFAMLGGILLHLAGYFLPFYFIGTKLEYSGSDAFTYFICATHMYRMQVFFVLAGFFARLVFRRRGYLGFTWHRFTRIAIPFAAGWIIMYPLCTMYHVWAAVDSGSMLIDKPFWQVVVACILDDELGGFSLVHLWFLYYLLLSYAAVIVGEWVLSVLVDRHGYIRQAGNWLFQRVMCSRLNVLWLSLALWPLLYWIGDWIGIITPADSLWPHWAAMITYTFFFLVGWLLHAQTHVLQRFEKGWALNLLAGIVISVGLFLFFEHGRANGSITFGYPLLFDTEIRDYDVIRAAVRQEGDPETVATTAFVRDALPPLYRRLVEETEKPNSAQMAGWTMELNKRLILEPTAFQPKTEEDRQTLARLQAEAARRGHAAIPIDATTGGTPLQHRWLLEAAFPPDTFTTNYVSLPNYRAIIAVYSAAYALGTWLLIFGLIGYFLRFFKNPSPLVRYLADSSYWLYLIHFPILWQINVLVADIPWHWLPKSLFYLIVSSAIMMPSYHYLVRSTWIGQLLNGRTYPVRPWFRRRREEVALEGYTPSESATVGDA